ncbi:hypothetical protein CLCR_11113 [Cladophialophora carrionii]|uniref:Uncharacterized protein n=1 Tax=Cladophialophora carrionii TaxID=86049 RepID=A0A1C1CX90_9EURO|nr:hypothetical protein CLCR_11113 [Cladophialophora carrionii]
MREKAKTRKRRRGSEDEEAKTRKRRRGSEDEEAKTRKRRRGSEDEEAKTRKDSSELILSFTPVLLTQLHSNYRIA